MADAAKAEAGGDGAEGQPGRDLVRSRVKVWEAMARGKQQATTGSGTSSEKGSPAGRGGRPPAPRAAAEKRAPWRLVDVSEQRVLKTGLLCLRDELAGGRGESLLDLPKRNDGSELIMRPSFLKRLLTGYFELKSCLESDVCAAQHDLRYLDCEQLLSIRGATLDFATESGSHNAHNNFLTSLDTQLFQKLTLSCLREGSVAAQQPEALHALGLRLALTRGAAEMLAESALGGGVPPPPACWAMRLDGAQWGGCKVALFNSRELRVDLLAGDGPGLAAAAGGGPVAVALERSSGAWKDRRLHWEVAAHDPLTDDILAELERVPEGEGVRRKLLGAELGEALRQRSTSRDEELASTPKGHESTGPQPSLEGLGDANRGSCEVVDRAHLTRAVAAAA